MARVVLLSVLHGPEENRLALLRGYRIAVNRVDIRHVFGRIDVYAFGELFLEIRFTGAEIAENKPGYAGKYYEDFAVFHVFPLNPDILPVFTGLCAIHVCKQKRESKSDFAFPGYIRLRPDRGYSGANPPNYKETTNRV